MIPLWDDQDPGDEAGGTYYRRLEAHLRKVCKTPDDQHLVYRHDGGWLIFHAPAGHGKILAAPADAFDMK